MQQREGAAAPPPLLLPAPWHRARGQPIAPSSPATGADTCTAGDPSRPVMVLAIAIVVVLCGSLATLLTSDGQPASAAGRFASSRLRAPVVWDNDALTPVASAPAAALPSRVVLPTVGVDASVGATGIGPKGELAVPDVFDQAFWFEGSAVPGEPGVSVLVGHLDDESGPAVFYRLELLKPGEEILIPRSDGATARYTVTEVKVFPKGRFPTERVFGASAGPGLRLITCIGRFDRRRKTYLDNLVVFAAPAASAAPLPPPAT